MEYLGNGAEMIGLRRGGWNRDASLGRAFKTIGRPRQPIMPCPTGRASRSRDSRHFMPGYHHAVPPGQFNSRRMLVCHCALVSRQNRSRRRVPMKKASVSYRTDLAVAKQPSGRTRSERLGDDTGIMIRDAK
jgi:hypothetical protein